MNDDEEPTEKLDEDSIVTDTTNSSDYFPNTLLALGDSYTIGQNVDPAETWPAQLTENLVGLGYIVEPVIIARTGWTTLNLKQAIEDFEYKDAHFGAVGLLIGVNNQFQGLNIENYETEFIDLLNTAIDMAGGFKNHVFVLSIPDYGYTPFGASNKSQISMEIDEFNEVNKRVSDSIGVQYFNITEISRRAETNPALLANDQLHPSGLMYERWVELIQPWYTALLDEG
ncbi:MAG: SGNH/GDSL hydrolase family protein [Reichenbachiella sp.]